MDEFLPVQTRGEMNHGRVRTVIGRYFEDKTASLLCGKVHKTDCRCEYCPDVSANGKFYEVKAVGNSGMAFIYAGRLVKDRQFSESHELYYVLWKHKVRTQTVETVAQLKSALQEKTVGYAIIPFSEIYSICMKGSPTKLNSKYGGSADNPLYGSGYRIPVSKFSFRN